MVFSSSRRDPIIKKIVILRHGRTTWNAERRFQGQEDPPLDEVGIAQAIKAASILNSIEYAKVVSSDLIRAQKTAEMVVGSSRVETDIAFRETHCGNWQGRTWPEIEKELEKCTMLCKFCHAIRHVVIRNQYIKDLALFYVQEGE